MLLEPIGFVIVGCVKRGYWKLRLSYHCIHVIPVSTMYFILISMHNQEGYGNEDVSEKAYMSYPKEYSQTSVRP